MTKSIIKTNTNKPAVKKNAKLTIAQLEKKMLKKFPAESACEWDRTGLTVGNKNQEITNVAVALDVTPEAIRISQQSGANLLVTHHPAFVEAVESFYPGNKVFEAASRGVALMNFHTALDLSEEGAGTLPRLLNLKDTGKMMGFGRVCKVKNMTLKQLAARCKSVFGKTPRVWGDFATNVKTVVTSSGSADVETLTDKFDCLICGEIKYHAALDLTQSGKCIIDLGHDVSELPFVGVLAKEIHACGVPKKNIILIDQTHNWTCPTSIKSN